MTTFQSRIRQATLEDVPQLVHLKQAVWQDEGSTAALIETALATPTHQAFVALVDDHAAGFVSCFMTESLAGEWRWEIDLLAVHADFRQRGLATRLVAEAADAGQKAGATTARALIAVDNIGSQRCFAQNGFRVDGAALSLFVSGYQPDDVVSQRKAKVPDDAHLVYVNTFNYRGIWVEGLLSLPALVAAQAECAVRTLDVVGALILDEDEHSATIARENGFECVGPFQQWRRAY